MDYGSALALSAGLALPIAVLGVAIAQGRAASAAFEGMARQPEAAGRLQTAMIIGLAFMEALALYVLLTFFLLMGKLGSVKEVTQAAAQVQQAATAAPSSPSGYGQ
jgi:F-type H+-transporting ATPase subunit c